MHTYETIISKLRSIRMKKGYTQEYMAYELGMSQSAYCKIENGRRRLDLPYLIKIIQLLDIEMGAFFDLDVHSNKMDNPQID